MTTSRGSELFVGRGRELGVLSSAIDSAANGAGRVVMISGEAGIGKTSLARHALSLANAAGFNSGIGRCREQRDTPPFWPWQQALSGILRTGASVAGSLNPVVEALSGEHSTVEGSKFARYQSAIAGIRTACEEKPMLLLLDDLQWTDAASMDLLEFLLLDLETIPLVLIGTIRSTEARDNEPLQTALAALSREHLYSEISLTGLGDDELKELLEQHSEPGSTLANIELLRTVSGGNPFFVKELAARSVSDPDDSLTLLRDAAVPDAIKQMIQRRMRSLSEDTKDALRTAALIGESFELELLMRVLKLPGSAQLLALLGPAEELGIVQADEGVESWRFHHAITRYALVDDLRAPDRIQKHLTIAEAIESEWDESQTHLAAELAYHYGQSQVLCGPEPVFKYSLAAGLHAIRTLAFSDAHSHLLKAEELNLSPGTKDEAELLDGLSQAKMAVGQNAQAFDYQIKAFEAWMTFGETARAIQTATHPIPGGGYPGTSEMTTQALELTEPNTLSRARMLSRYMWVANPNPRENGPIFEEAISILEKNPDPATEIWLRGRWGAAFIKPGYYEAGLKELDRALALAPIAGDPEAETHCHFWAAFGHGAIGNTEEMLRHVSACKIASSRTRRAIREFQWARTAIFATALLGEFEKLDWLFDQVENLRSETGSNIPVVKAVAWAEQGHVEEARKYIREKWKPTEIAGVDPKKQGDPSNFVSVAFASLRFADITGDREFVQMADSTLRTIVKRDGGDPETFRTGDRFPDFDIDNEDSEAPFFIYSYCGSLAINASEYSPAAVETLTKILSRHKNILIPDSGGGWIYLPLALDRMVGRLYAIAGNADAAAQRFDAAIEFCENAGYLPEAAWSYHDRVAFALDYKAPLSRSLAQSKLQAGMAIAEKLGMKPVHQRMTALMERVGGLREGRGSVSARPDGLTAREVEVLIELGRGRSNREIAEALFISQNTVIRHVSNIFAKTGCANRAEAAAYASQSGLLGGGER